MKTRIDPALLKKCLRTLPIHQKTFQTPLEELDRYVSTIVGSVPDLSYGELLIASYAFKPEKFNRTLSEFGFDETARAGLVIELESGSEIQDILKAAFTEWIDFVFTSKPKTIRLYADHDECSTFYGSSKSNLNKVVQRLQAAEFSEVTGYVRP